jgi:hypothetical protein
MMICQKSVLSNDIVFLDSPTELVGTAGGFESAADALQPFDDSGGFHPFHQSAYPLQVAVATAHELDIVQSSLVVNVEVDGYRTGGLGIVGEVFHC